MTVMDVLMVVCCTWVMIVDKGHNVLLYAALSRLRLDELDELSERTVAELRPAAEGKMLIVVDAAKEAAK